MLRQGCGDITLKCGECRGRGTEPYTGRRQKAITVGLSGTRLGVGGGGRSEFEAASGAGGREGQDRGRSSSSLGKDDTLRLCHSARHTPTWLAGPRVMLSRGRGPGPHRLA